MIHTSLVHQSLQLYVARWRWLWGCGLIFDLLQAEGNAEVQRRIVERLPVLQDLVIRILDRLRQTINSVPYGIRWLCKAVRSLILEKFPDATTERINSFIGGFFFLRYINPIIATPHGMFVASECYLKLEPPPLTPSLFPSLSFPLPLFSPPSSPPTLSSSSVAYQLVLNPPSHQCRRNLTLVGRMEGS